MLKSKLTDLKPEHIDPIISDLSAYFKQTGGFADREEFAHLDMVASQPLLSGLIRHYTDRWRKEAKDRIISICLEMFYIGWHARGAVEERAELEPK